MKLKQKSRKTPMSDVAILTISIQCKKTKFIQIGNLRSQRTALFCNF